MRIPVGPLAAGLLVLLSAWPVFAQGVPGGCASCGEAAGGCASCSSCGSGKCGPCPPKWHYTYEGPPKIKWHKGCPRPVCDPCRLEHYGYYQTCWAPWPFGPDWSHCPCPPPGAVLPPPPYPPYSPKRGNPPPLNTIPDRAPRGPESTPGAEPNKPNLPEFPPPRPLDNQTSVRLVPYQ